MRRCICTGDPGDKLCRCAGCNRWWELHEHLSDEVRAKVWEFPVVEDPRAGNPEPPGTLNHTRWRPDERGRALWRALTAGACQLRREERARRIAARAQPEA